MEDCIAIGNKRGFRIWGAGTLVNCFSGQSAEGIWTSTGPVVAERTTIALWRNRATSSEEVRNGIELRNCLLAGGAVSIPEDAAQSATLVGTVQLTTLEAAGIRSFPENWRGRSSELSASKVQGKGFTGR